MRKLRKGESYAHFPTSNSKIQSLKPIAYGLLLCFMFSLSDALAQSVETRTAERQTDIKPLKIGDTIPDELWDLPLQVINHPDGNDTITLNDYRDKKLIILDFWATWCGSCLSSIRNAKEILSLNSNLAIIPIAGQTADEISNAKSMKYWFKDDSVFSVVGDKIFGEIFNKQFVPYLVWIKDGKVYKTTDGTVLSLENVQNTLGRVRDNLNLYYSVKNKQERGRR